jgi:chromosome segregation ATPase
MLHAARERANPIRKVVTMLQNMQNQVTKEGENQAELFEKFMCYCKNGRGTLEASIADAQNKIANFEATVGEKIAKKKQTEADLAKHKDDRADAKDAMAQATELRKKEAAAYAKESSDAQTNIAALAKATAAIEKGATGFLQTNDANIVRTLAIEKATLADASREELLSFLSGTQAEGYVPQSGEIVGILKQMHDEMSAGLADATAAEDAAIATYDALMKAKKEEVAALSAQIEAEIKRVGELGVEIAGMENDLEETKEALAEDTKFLAELNKGCDTKAAEYEEMKKTRAEELVALSETIKVLNDDDALDLFKKTLPSASASFVQVLNGVASMRSRAVSILRKPARVELDLIALALNGKQQGFEKVTKMIDEMVGNLKREQEEDDDKKAYCNDEFDKTDDKKKGLEQNIADSETAMEELEGAIATLRDEIAALEAGIAALDKSVAQATEQRKEEHADYKSLMANDGAAKEVLAWAKNRLNKFYNPKLYVAPPKRELSEEDRITVNMGGTLAPTQPPGGIAGTGISALAQVAPPPPPSIGTYGKKSEEGNGVIAMIDLLVKDLDKEMTEAKVTETDAQDDYEKLMAESAEKRAQDSKAIADKNASKANAEESLQAEGDAKASASKELGLTLEAIHALHGECDWLLKYFDARKEARVGEVSALENAKAVLAGADYSLVQTSASRLRGSQRA